MDRLKKIVVPLIVGLSLAVTSAVWSAPRSEQILAATHTPQSITLRHVLQIVLSENPNVLAARANKYAAYYGLRGAKGGYLPNLDFEFQQGQEYSRTHSSRSLSTLDRQERSLVLTQMLFDGMAVRDGVKQNRYLWYSSRAELHSARQNAGLAAIRAYLNILRNRRLVTVSKDNVAAHIETLRKVTIRTREGAGAQIDVHLTRSRLNLAQSRYENAKKLLEDADAAYYVVVGRLPSPRMKAPKVPYRALPKTFSKAMSFAQHDRATVSASIDNYLASRAGVGVARANYYPTISLEASTGRNRNLNGVPGYFRTHKVMVVVNYNLFRGGADYAAVHQAQEQRVQALDNLAATRRTVAQEVSLAWNAYQESRVQIQRLTWYVYNSSRVVSGYKKRFVLGQPLFDLLDAEKEYFSAITQLVNAKYDRMAGAYTILQSMGKLLPVVLQQQAAARPIYRMQNPRHPQQLRRIIKHTNRMQHTPHHQLQSVQQPRKPQHKLQPVQHPKTPHHKLQPVQHPKTPHHKLQPVQHKTLHHKLQPVPKSRGVRQHHRLPAPRNLTALPHAQHASSALILTSSQQHQSHSDVMQHAHHLWSQLRRYAVRHMQRPQPKLRQQTVKRVPHLLRQHVVKRPLILVQRPLILKPAQPVLHARHLHHRLGRESVGHT